MGTSSVHGNLPPSRALRAYPNRRDCALRSRPQPPAKLVRRSIPRKSRLTPGRCLPTSCPLDGRVLISLAASTWEGDHYQITVVAPFHMLQAVLPCYLIVRSARRPWSKQC
ncbi:hypothetical protein PV04_08556 [Phialophora macrospora]|uniref:Uncharacterized protein n=1 Tax=Phialophora macrospora TaxID=1851006 RepID=A0A0D2F9L2_9EURO|nr:hypothetical protein PV04_08556 [Phialophora macrospora]